MSDRTIDARGNWRDRKARKQWLLYTFGDGTTAKCALAVTAECPGDLTLDTLSVDRIIPGFFGGRYVRDNIQPACMPCNSYAGGLITMLQAAMIDTELWQYDALLKLCRPGWNPTVRRIRECIAGNARPEPTVTRVQERAPVRGYSVTAAWTDECLPELTPNGGTYVQPL